MYVVFIVTAIFMFINGDEHCVDKYLFTSHFCMFMPNKIRLTCQCIVSYNHT